MQLITGTWIGALVSADGLRETPFSLSQPGYMQDCLVRDGLGQDRLFHDRQVQDGLAPQTFAPAITIAGSAPIVMRLLEGADTALVALADLVPDPTSGVLAQLLLEARLRGDRLVGNWLRRDASGVMLSRGTLVATASQRAEVHPAGVRHAEAPHAEVRHAEVRHADVRHADVRHAEVRHADVRYAEVQQVSGPHAEASYPAMRHTAARFAGSHAAA